MAQPVTAAAVAASQRARGRLGLPVAMDRTPVKTGAAPMVTTVPTATPAKPGGGGEECRLVHGGGRRADGEEANPRCASRGLPGCAARRRATPREGRQH